MRSHTKRETILRSIEPANKISFSQEEIERFAFGDLHAWTERYREFEHESPDQKAEREAKLFAAVKQGDLDARDEILVRYAGMIYRRIRRYRSDRDLHRELFQECLLVLMRCVAEYDPEKGPFFPYADASVRREIARFFHARSGIACVPRDERARTVQFERPPKVGSGSDNIETPPGTEIQGADRYHRTCADHGPSGWREIGNRCANEFPEDAILESLSDEPDEPSSADVAREQIRQLAEITPLDRTERQVLYLHVDLNGHGGGCMDYTEIANETGLSLGYVEHVMVRIRKKMRETAQKEAGQ